MNKIFENGLIAIGAVELGYKTAFAIQLANDIAKKEKVLYLNWTDYADHLHHQIKKSGQEVSKNLDINTNVGYFDAGSFINIMELIEINNYTTVFIDDINTYSQSGDMYTEFDEINSNGKDNVIRALRYIVDKMKVRVFFNITITTDNLPKLKDFVWSRLIINDCDQVIALNKIDNKLEIFKLKNQNLEIEKHEIKLI